MPCPPTVPQGFAGLPKATRWRWELERTVEDFTLLQSSPRYPKAAFLGARGGVRGEGRGRKFLLALRPRPPALPVPSPAGCPARSDADLVTLTSAGRGSRELGAPGRAMGQGEWEHRCGGWGFARAGVGDCHLPPRARSGRPSQPSGGGAVRRAGCARTGRAGSPRAGSGSGKRGRCGPQLLGETLHGVQFVRRGPPEPKDCGRGDRPAPSPLLLLCSRGRRAARRPFAANWLRAAAGAGTWGRRRGAPGRGPARRWKRPGEAGPPPAAVGRGGLSARSLPP